MPWAEWATGPSAAARTDLGKYHVGTYHWEDATWKNASGKLPKIMKIQIGEFRVQGYCNFFSAYENSLYIVRIFL